MKYADVLASQQVVTTGERDRIADAVRLILGKNHVRYYDVIEGAPSSGRLFLTVPYHEAAKLPCEFDYSEVAAQLLLYARDESDTGNEGARYPAPLAAWQQKGWEIRKMLVDGQPAVLAFAAWV